MLKRKFLNSCGLINAAVSDQDILSQINKLIIPKIKKPQTRIEKNEYLLKLPTPKRTMKP